jgi:hypothetical protein
MKMRIASHRLTRMQPIAMVEKMLRALLIYDMKLLRRKENRLLSLSGIQSDATREEASLMLLKTQTFILKGKY